MINKSLLLALILMLTSGLAWAQGTEPPPKDAPVQDKQALKLLGGAQKLIYSPMRFGLQALSYEHRLSQYPGFTLKVGYEQGKPRTCKLSAEAELQVDNELIQRYAAVLEPAAGKVSELVVGEDDSHLWSKSDVVMKGERTVRITPKGSAQGASFEYKEITFDAQGLPQSMTVKGAMGLLAIKLTHQPLGTHFVLSESKTTMSDQKVVTTFTWGATGGFHFPTRVKTSQQGKSTVQEFSRFQPKGTPRKP